MATEEEAQETTDEQEVQVAVDLGTAHFQTHLDSKLPFNKAMDSTEGILKIPEDQVLVEAPSEVKFPPELSLNGTSLNGYMDKEGNIPNGQPHENDQKDKEQVENSLDGTSNDKEVIDSLGHGDSISEDSSLQQHENEEPKEHDPDLQELEGDVTDDKMVHEDTLKIDNAVEPTVDLQQGQNLELEKTTEDTHSASISNILDEEAEDESPAGVQTPLEPNVDNSNALVNTIDGNTGSVEPAIDDDIAHLEHSDSSPEDKDRVEHADEVATIGDQQSKQTNVVDAGMVQEEIPKSKETEVLEEMPKTEQAVGSTIDAQLFNKELPEEANDTVYEETEVTSHQRSVAVSEETTPEQVAMLEPAVEFQEVQNQESVEEMINPKAADTEKTTEGSSASFDRQIPEDHAVTTTSNSDIHLHNVEPEEIKGPEEANESSMASSEDAVQDKALPSESTIDIQAVHGLEHGETENPGSEEMDEASNQIHATVHNNIAQEDGVEACELHVTELAEDMKDIEVTKTQEITHQCHADASKKLQTEDNVDDSNALKDTTDENTGPVEPADDDVHVDHNESFPEDKDNAGHADKEVTIEDEQSKQTDAADACVVQEEIPTSKETEVQEEIPTSKETEEQSEIPETEQAVDSTIDAQVFNKELPEETNDLVYEETVVTSDQSSPVSEETTPEQVALVEPTINFQEVQTKGSAEEMTDAKALDTEKTIEQSSASFEEKIPEDHAVTTTESSDIHVHNMESEEIKGLEDASESSVASAEDAVQGKALPSGSTADLKAVHGLQQGETGYEDMDESSNQKHAAADSNLAQEDGVGASESHVTELAEDVKDIDVTETEVTHQCHADTSKEVQTEDNVDDYNAIVDTIYGNIGSVEPDDEIAHLEHNESSPEDKDRVEHADEVAKIDDQQSKQIDAVDADMVQGLISKSKETEVQKEMPETEQTVDPILDAQVLNEELPEEANDSVYEETEVTSHQSSLAVSEETTPEQVAIVEPAVNFQEVQNQGSVEEMTDARAVDTEETTEQSRAAFEEQIPEDHVVTITPSSDIHVHTVESEEIKGLEGANESSVACAKDAVQDKTLPSEPTVDIQAVQGLEQGQTENAGSEEMDEASNQMHSAIHNNLAQEDGVGASESHITELAEDVKDIEATETPEVTHQCHADNSKKLSTEDNSIPNGPHDDDIQKSMEQDLVEVEETEAAETQGINQERIIYTSEDTVEANLSAPACDTQEIQSVESPEEIKDKITENITEVFNTTTVDEQDLENIVLTSEAIPEQQTWGLPEEIINTEPVEIDASDQRHAALFNDLAQEDNTTENETQKMESAGDTKKSEAIPQESEASISEGPNPEDNITAHETATDSKEVNNVGSAEEIEGKKGIEFEEFSDYGKESFAVEAGEESNALEIEAKTDIQPLQELESEEMMNTEPIVESGTSHQMDHAVVQDPAEEDNPSACELHMMESAEVSNIEAIEAQATLHQTNAVQSEKQETEENTTSEAQILKPEYVEEIKDANATESHGISQQRTISISEEFVPEENFTRKEQGYDNKEVQNEEPGFIKVHDDVKAQQISNQSTGIIVREADQENSFLASEQSNDMQVKKLESEEIKNTEDVATEEDSHQMHVATVEENLTAREAQILESSHQMNGIETTIPERTLHESNIASVGEKATEDNAIVRPEVDVEQHQEKEAVQFKDTEATEPQGISPSNIVSAPEAEGSAPEDNVTTEPSSVSQAEKLESTEVIEDTEGVKSNVVLADEGTPEKHILAPETTIDVPSVQETELAATNDTDPVDTPHIITRSGLLLKEVKGTEAMETESIPHGSTASSIKEPTADMENNVALEDKAATEEHAPAADTTVDTPQVQEPELEEIKNTEPIEVKNTETMVNKEIPQGNTVASIKELTKDGILTASVPDADIQQVLEQESVEDMKCADSTEYQGESQQRIVCTCDEHVPTEEQTTVTEPTCDTQIQNDVAQEIKENEDVRTEEISSDSTFFTPEAVTQESDTLIGEPISDTQQVQEPSLAEEIKGIEDVETEDHQQHRISTLEKLVLENNVAEIEPRVDEQQLKEKSVVAIDIEAMEIKEIFDQSNIITSENAVHESSELQRETETDVYVQSKQRLELPEDSKGSQPVNAEETKAEETEQSKFSTLQEPGVEDNYANEIGSSDDIKQENELESVSEIKEIDARKAEEASYISQVAALEEPPSESNTGTTEMTYNMQQVNNSETIKEMKSTEDINDEEISCEQADIGALEDQDNRAASEELPVDSNKENLGNEINNEMLVHEKIEDEIQDSTELKDKASGFSGKAISTAQVDENLTEVEAIQSVQSSGEATIETSHHIDQIKEEPEAVAEHDSTHSSKLSSDQHEENIGHVQDGDIKGKLLIESGKEEVFHASVEPQAAQDAAEEDDTIKSCEQINDQDNNQHHDLVLQMQICERSMDDLAIDQQDEDVEKATLHQQQKEGEKIKEKTEEIQKDEQKHEDEKTDFTTEPLVEPQIPEVFTNKVEDTDASEAEQTETLVNEMLKNENTLHERQESIRRITDMNVEKVMGQKEGTEEENELNDAVKENCNEDEPKNIEKDEVVAKASTDEQYGATDEIKDEEVRNVTENIEILDEQEPLNIQDEPGLSSYVEKDLQEISDQTPSNDDTQENLEPEENTFDMTAKTESNEKMEASYTADTEAIKFDEDNSDKATRADEALSDENLKTFQDTRSDFDVSAVVVQPQRESINEDIEDHTLALPAQPTIVENTTEQVSDLELTERELSLSKKVLPDEAKEREEDPITKEQDEEDMHEPEIVDVQVEAEGSDLPVSNFLMDLILGKESNDPNGKSESEAEKKQEETTKDENCFITSQQEESSVPFPAESKQGDKFISEQEEQNVQSSEEIHEMSKVSHDFKLETERSLETEEELNRKNHSKAPEHQENKQDEISSELILGEATGLVTKMGTRDIKLDEKAVYTICQEDVEATTQTEAGSLNRNLGDSTSPKASQEDTLDRGRSELLHDSLLEDKSSDAVAEQTLPLTEPDMSDAEKLPNTHSLQSPLCIELEDFNEDSIVEDKSTIEVHLESDGVDKKEGNQHATTSGATEEQRENLHDTLLKSKGSEEISDEQAPEITEPVSGTNINLVQKKIYAGSTRMGEKETYIFSNNEKPLEIHPDGSNLHINQDKHDLSADGQVVSDKNSLLHKPGECKLQAQQETDAVQRSPKEPDEGCQKSLVIEEPVFKEENIHETVESHVETVNIKPNEEQEAKLQVQEPDLHVASPKEAPEVDESFVEITKPEFSTDEEQSPKADESNMAEEKIYNEKTKDEEADKKFTDEAPMKIEERGAGQKASPKKHNILSGVGSKVKHQLAKVKKAIIGKPGHTKSESPKS